MRGSGRRCRPRKSEPPSGPVTRIWSPGRAPERHRPRRGGLAQECHVDHQRSVPGIRVAADQVDLEPVGHPLEPGVQALGDSTAGARQGHRDHGGPRHPRHRGDVGEVHPHGLVADGLGTVALEMEVAAVHEHVGRDQEP